MWSSAAPIHLLQGSTCCTVTYAILHNLVALSYCCLRISLKQSGRSSLTSSIHKAFSPCCWSSPLFAHPSLWTRTRHVTVSICLNAMNCCHVICWPVRTVEQLYLLKWPVSVSGNVIPCSSGSETRTESTLQTSAVSTGVLCVLYYSVTDHGHKMQQVHPRLVGFGVSQWKEGWQLESHSVPCIATLRTEGYFTQRNEQYHRITAGNNVKQ